MQKPIIDIEPDFFLHYEKLPKTIRKKFIKQVKLLKENPKHPSLQLHKLEGTDFWEFYVDNSYRCVLKIEGNIYKLYRVGTHKLIDRF